jgi:DNA-binding Xre family transcriptional regulator
MKRSKARLRVRELAEAKGWNITDLSFESRLAYSQAHRIWHDNVSQLDFNTLEKLARALNVRIGDLFADTINSDNEENRSPRYEAALAS